MPADQRCRRHHQPRPPATGQQTAQRGEERTVLGFKAPSRMLAAQNLELVTQDDDLDLLGIPGAEQHQEQFHHTADAELDQGPNHHILPADRQRPSTATRSPVAANSLVTRHGRVLTPHASQAFELSTVPAHARLVHHPDDVILVGIGGLTWRDG